ncbi:hypothetical protein [uncultured Microbacterium sp.]|uniref:hypothetical protein n=1 Tax=uncultured Microbacterium sp. TaxID=191216 RepID=UPI0028F12525|nr:hypothetical protein [uncultured Microbacterium sp.]
MKWSAIVAVGFAVAAIGLLVLAFGLMMDQPLWGLVITALGGAIALVGGAKHFAERN